MKNPLRRRVDEPDDPLHQGVLWAVHALLGRWAMVVGAPLLALGAGFLAAAWHVGPQSWLLEREMRSLTAPVVASAVKPFWWLDADLDRVREGGHWSNHAQMRLCLDVDYRVGEGAFSRVFCDKRRQASAPQHYGVHDVQALLPGMPLAWPRDEFGNPEIELRLHPEVHGWLAERPAAHWPLSGQTESARERMPPPGSELDYLLLEFDRPLEWLVRAWPAVSESVITLRHDPQQPAAAYPEAFIAAFDVGSGHIVLAVFLALIGVGLWGHGVAITLYDQSPNVRWALGVLPLLLLPWWSNALGGVLRWTDAQAYYLGVDFSSELLMGVEIPLETHGSAEFAEFVRIGWPVLGGDSHYAELLALVALRRPDPPPIGPDAALRAASEQVVGRIRMLDGDDAARLFNALAWAELIDRGEIGLLFLAAARETALDAERPEVARRAAVNFLEWLAITPIQPLREEPAFDARVELWRSLHDFPPAPGLAAGARTLVERATAGGEEPVP